MPASAFEYFLNRENSRLVKLLERNHDVSTAIEGILDAACRYCEDKGVRFEQLKIRESFVIPTDDGDAMVRIVFGRK